MWLGTMLKFRFKSREQRHTVYEELDGYRFECESDSLECMHWLSPDKYPYFVLSLGYPRNTNVMAAIVDRAQVHRDKSLVANAIHFLTINLFSDQKVND